MAEGVGVMGGGLVGVVATFRRLFGVDGGGSISDVAASLIVPSWATALVATSSVALDFRARFSVGAVASAMWPLGSSGLAWTLADLLKDMVISLKIGLGCRE